MLFLSLPGRRADQEMSAMTERTCAACDCELDAETIKVKIGGQTVEVCCDDCAQALREADASTSGGE
jgi:hypothetical protein